jgi:hypothetical protein
MEDNDQLSCKPSATVDSTDHETMTKQEAAGVLVSISRDKSSDLPPLDTTLAFNSIDEARRSPSMRIRVAPSNDDVAFVRINERHYITRILAAMASDVKGPGPWNMERAAFEEWMSKFESQVAAINGNPGSKYQAERFAWLILVSGIRSVHFSPVAALHLAFLCLFEWNQRRSFAANKNQAEVYDIHEIGILEIVKATNSVSHSRIKDRTRKTATTNTLNMKCSQRLEEIIKTLHHYGNISSDIITGNSIRELAEDPYRLVRTKIDYKRSNNLRIKTVTTKTRQDLGGQEVPDARSWTYAQSGASMRGSEPSPMSMSQSSASSSVPSPSEPPASTFGEHIRSLLQNDANAPVRQTTHRLGQHTQSLPPTPILPAFTVPSMPRPIKQTRATRSDTNLAALEVDDQQDLRKSKKRRG